MIEELLIKLSGKPKPKDINDIKESIILLALILQLSIAFTIGVLAVMFHIYFGIIISIIFAWQAGWGMSIGRLVNDEKMK